MNDHFDDGFPEVSDIAAGTYRKATGRSGTDLRPEERRRRLAQRGQDLLSRDDIERETGGGVTRRWLEIAAHRGDGPPMLKISRRCVRYRRGEFEAWLETRRVENAGSAT